MALKVDGVVHNGGSHRTEAEAIAACKVLSLKLHGAFSPFNAR
jgi:hypothetical protein